jgi:hypothetical protein
MTTIVELIVGKIEAGQNGYKIIQNCLIKSAT